MDITEKLLRGAQNIREVLGKDDDSELGSDMDQIGDDSDDSDHECGPRRKNAVAVLGTRERVGKGCGCGTTMWPFSEGECEAEKPSAPTMARAMTCLDRPRFCSSSRTNKSHKSRVGIYMVLVF